ncbi:MAG TPA: alpha/beta hydrolase [Chloroflexota bacterium]|nr:alpha/beta hydrolase [Chloroflexota bacterium]
MTEETVREIGGYSTRLLQAGLGPDVIWLHDTLGNLWTPGHEALSRGAHVIAPTLPGFDDSTNLDGIDEPEDVVFWLLDLLSELRLDRPAVLGCGLGGWMAAELAVRYPERVGRLILVDAYGLHVDGALPADEFALPTPALRPLLFREPDGALALQWLPNVVPPERAAGVLHARVAAARLAWQFPYSPKLRGRLRRANMPSLILWGAHDGLVSTAHARAYADELPRSRSVVVESAAHYPYIEEPDRFADEVRRFIS